MLLVGLWIPHSSSISVEVDTFVNNRLSLILQSDSLVRDLVSLHVEGTDKGASVLYETLKDSKTAYSEDPEHAPAMYARSNEGITGKFFDLMKKEVRKCLIHASSIHLMLCSRMLKERCVAWYFDNSRIQPYI
jgi:hypothetical protein